MNTTWSDTLIRETRNAIAEYLVTPQGMLHMKCVDGRYGVIRLENLISNHFLIEFSGGGGEQLYLTTDELIEAGWAID